LPPKGGGGRDTRAVALPTGRMGFIGTFLCCWKELLYGRACMVYNCLFSPCILAIWACSIYFCECLRVFFNRGFYKFCCCICRCMACCWLFTDTSFPPDESSLGQLGGDTANEAAGKMEKNVIWLRANGFSKDGKMQLFGNTIDSSDICQGALGNCWLLAAMACLAEHKGAVNSVFRSKERNPRGKYRLRLYDGVKERWEQIVVDDYIPCDKDRYEKDGVAKPVFSQPNGNELYAMLLEKAFAKFCGSYASTEGGQTIWAIRAMTGDPARWFCRNDQKNGWTRKDLKNIDDPKNRRASSLVDKGETIDNATMFEVLLKYHKLKSVLCASGSSGQGGLHKGHAYSILQVRKVTTGWMGVGGDTYRLVEIRNPWGNGEWKGDWSDHSDLWTKHEAVKKAVGFEDVDDGAFWMSWDDYVDNWDKIGVIDRTVDINSLRLHVKDDSACAPAVGCCGGCCRFWCCCEGPKRLYFPHRSSAETVKVKKSCCAIL